MYCIVQALFLLRDALSRPLNTPGIEKHLATAFWTTKWYTFVLLSWNLKLKRYAPLYIGLLVSSVGLYNVYFSLIITLRVKV